MLRVGNRHQKVLVAPDSSAIFWRAGSLTLYAHWVLGLGIRVRAALEQDFMFPAVAKVVGANADDGQYFAMLGQTPVALVEAQAGLVRVVRGFNL